MKTTFEVACEILNPYDLAHERFVMRGSKNANEQDQAEGFYEAHRVGIMHRLEVLLENERRFEALQEALRPYVEDFRLKRSIENSPLTRPAR